MGIGDSIHHRAVRFGAHRRIHGGHALIEAQQALHVRRGSIQHVRYFFCTGFVIKLLGQLTGRPQVNIEFLHHMDRQANSAGLVHDAALDRLPNPPGGVGGETETALRVEFFHGANQAQVALLDQVQQRKPAVDITTGNLHHQAQVALDHPAAGTVITFQCQAGEVFLLIGGKQRRVANFVEV